MEPGRSQSSFSRGSGARRAYGRVGAGAARFIVGRHRIEWGQDGHTVETLLRWVRQHERDSGQRDGMPSAEAQRIKDLEREVRELRRANEILLLASAFFAQAELDCRLK